VQLDLRRVLFIPSVTVCAAVRQREMRVGPFSTIALTTDPRTTTARITVARVELARASRRNPHHKLVGISRHSFHRYRALPMGTIAVTKRRSALAGTPNRLRCMLGLMPKRRSPAIVGSGNQLRRRRELMQICPTLLDSAPAGEACGASWAAPWAPAFSSRPRRVFVAAPE
jgi:hypothetical protein